MKLDSGMYYYRYESWTWKPVDVSISAHLKQKRGECLKETANATFKKLK